LKWQTANGKRQTADHQVNEMLASPMQSALPNINHILPSRLRIIP
jgi:hypothetical protein